MRRNPTVSIKVPKDPLIVSITGHRFFKSMAAERYHLFKTLDKFLDMLERSDIEMEHLIFIHGCATGVDLWFGEFAMDVGLQLELYLPFKRITQIVKGRMSKHQRTSLDAQIAYADKVAVVNSTFSTYGYQKRNIVLVKRCHILTSYYSRQRSGSGNCVRYALSVNRPIIHLRDIADISEFEANIHHQLINFL